MGSVQRLESWAQYQEPKYSCTCKGHTAKVAHVLLIHQVIRLMLESWYVQWLQIDRMSQSIFDRIKYSHFSIDHIFGLWAGRGIWVRSYHQFSLIFLHAHPAPPLLLPNPLCFAINYNIFFADQVVVDFLLYRR